MHNVLWDGRRQDDTTISSGTAIRLANAMEAMTMCLRKEIRIALLLAITLGPPSTSTLAAPAPLAGHPDPQRFTIAPSGRPILGPGGDDISLRRPLVEILPL